MKKLCTSFLIMTITWATFAQTSTIRGSITDTEGSPLPFVNIFLKGQTVGSNSDTEGVFEIRDIPFGNHILVATAVGIQKYEQPISPKPEDKNLVIHVKMQPADERLEEIVVTGTMKEVRRSESPAPIEVYQAKFFLKNPTPNLFEKYTQFFDSKPTHASV